ncbi:MAG: hypothetical protein J6A15_07995 [Clostridia bacterium]|nr:hypothetical protein [Clostridia bacterium]
MIRVKRVKIYNSWMFSYNIRQLKYQYVVMMEGLNLYGNIEINFVTEEVNVKLNNPNDSEGPRDLVTNSVVKDEVVRLAILKEIFYRFCVKSKESIENFKFKYRDEKESKSIIEELMNYESILYDETLKSERVLYSIVEGYNVIKKTNKNNTVAHLEDMTRLKNSEREKAFDILKRYLESINDGGILDIVEVGYDYKMSVVYISKYRKVF